MAAVDFLFSLASFALGIVRKSEKCTLLLNGASTENDSRTKKLFLYNCGIKADRHVNYAGQLRLLSMNIYSKLISVCCPCFGFVFPLFIWIIQLLKRLNGAEYFM